MPVQAMPSYIHTVVYSPLCTVSHRAGYACMTLFLEQHIGHINRVQCSVMEQRLVAVPMSLFSYVPHWSLPPGPKMDTAMDTVISTCSRGSTMAGRQAGAGMTISMILA